MFVHDRAKARFVALVMSAVAGIQVVPTAHAAPAPTANATNEADTNQPKKSKKTYKSAEKKDKKDVDPIKVVLKAAHKQLGKPYRWAAVGPNSFDCSGFTMYVWQKAGVSLPHNSGAQRAATKHVSLDKMKPGDLIFSSGHVGLYIGKGKMIHSPRTGRTVSIDPIHSRAYGAGRPKL